MSLFLLSVELNIIFPQSQVSLKIYKSFDNTNIKKWNRLFGNYRGQVRCAAVLLFRFSAAATVVNSSFMSVILQAAVPGC